MNPTTAIRPFTVALVGNPNTGKSTLFGGLVGVHQRVGNYPGVTVEKRIGHMTFAARRFEMIDLPGLYSLAPRSRDEMVVVDLLLGRMRGQPSVDAVVCIVDAGNLERNLYLVSQVWNWDCRRFWIEHGRCRRTPRHPRRRRRLEEKLGVRSCRSGQPPAGLDRLMETLGEFAFEAEGCLYKGDCGASRLFRGSLSGLWQVARSPPSAWGECGAAPVGGEAGGAALPRPIGPLPEAFEAEVPCSKRSWPRPVWGSQSPMPRCLSAGSCSIPTLFTGLLLDKGDGRWASGSPRPTLDWPPRAYPSPPSRPRPDTIGHDA